MRAVKRRIIAIALALCLPLGGCAALLEQSNYSQLQRVGGKFWDPVAAFSASMAQGNPSGASLQAQLDRMVEGVIER